METLCRRTWRGLGSSLICLGMLAGVPWTSARASRRPRSRSRRARRCRAPGRDAPLGAADHSGDHVDRTSGLAVGLVQPGPAPDFQQVRRTNQFVEMSAEEYSSETARLAQELPGLSRLSTGSQGAGTGRARDGMTDVYAMLGWLSTVGVNADGPRMIRDEGLAGPPIRRRRPSPPLPSPQYAPPSKALPPSAPAPRRRRPRRRPRRPRSWCP